MFYAKQFPHQFEVPVKNIERMSGGGYCGVTSTWHALLTFKPRRMVHFELTRGYQLEILDFKIGFCPNNTACFLLNDPRKTVCFQEANPEL